MLGAFAAHGLESLLQRQGLESTEVVKKLGQCEVAVRYQMLHTLAILALSLTMRVRGISAWAVGLWLAGIGLFCGGLYSMVFFNRMGHWSIVPSGGLCFMLGWLALLALAWTVSQNQASATNSHR
jgi:uncharacterized membrane protein YgdD (TMEM256/DUF423 family)